MIPRICVIKKLGACGTIAGRAELENPRTSLVAAIRGDIKIKVDGS